MYDIITLIVEAHDNSPTASATKLLWSIPPGTPKASVKCWLKKV